MMNENHYCFKLGELECLTLSDGSYDYPPKNFFANAPDEQIEGELRQCNLPTDYIRTPYTYLYIDTGAHEVLVDMGAGNLAPSTGNLIPNMQAAGIEPEDIDRVFITHAHPDHIGGALDNEGRPVFVNAHYYIWKEEWKFWTSDDAFNKAPEYFVALAREVLEPIHDRLHLLDQEGEILPGIGVLAAPGHTPGHMVVSVASGGERLLYVSDTVLYPLHLEHPDWVPIYDILPEEAEASKRRIFDMAAEEKTWVIGQHFPPFPSLGHVVNAGKGWRWQPVGTTH